MIPHVKNIYSMNDVYISVKKIGRNKGERAENRQEKSRRVLISPVMAVST